MIPAELTRAVLGNRAQSSQKAATEARSQNEVHLVGMSRNERMLDGLFTLQTSTKNRHSSRSDSTSRSKAEAVPSPPGGALRAAQLHRRRRRDIFSSLEFQHRNSQVGDADAINDDPFSTHKPQNSSREARLDRMLQLPPATRSKTTNSIRSARVSDHPLPRQSPGAATRFSTIQTDDDEENKPDSTSTSHSNGVRHKAPSALLGSRSTDSDKESTDPRETLDTPISGTEPKDDNMRNPLAKQSAAVADSSLVATEQVLSAGGSGPHSIPVANTGVGVDAALPASGATVRSPDVVSTTDQTTTCATPPSAQQVVFNLVRCAATPAKFLKVVELAKQFVNFSVDSCKATGPGLNPSLDSSRASEAKKKFSTRCNATGCGPSGAGAVSAAEVVSRDCPFALSPLHVQEILLRHIVEAFALSPLAQKYAEARPSLASILAAVCGGRIPKASDLGEGPDMWNRDLVDSEVDTFLNDPISPKSWCSILSVSLVYHNCLFTDDTFQFHQGLAELERFFELLAPLEVLEQRALEPLVPDWDTPERFMGAMVLSLKGGTCSAGGKVPRQGVSCDKVKPDPEAKPAQLPGCPAEAGAAQGGYIALGQPSKTVKLEPRDAELAVSTAPVISPSLACRPPTPPSTKNDLQEGPAIKSSGDEAGTQLAPSIDTSSSRKASVTTVPSSSGRLSPAQVDLLVDVIPSRRGAFKILRRLFFQSLVTLFAFDKTPWARSAVHRLFQQVYISRNRVFEANERIHIELWQAALRRVATAASNTAEAPLTLSIGQSANPVQDGRDLKVVAVHGAAIWSAKQAGL